MCVIFKKKKFSVITVFSFPVSTACVLLMSLSPSCPCHVGAFSNWEGFIVGFI